MTKSRMKFGALLVVMLIVSMALVPAVSAQAEKVTPIADETSTGDCTECTNNEGCSGGIAGNPTKLQGIEKDKALDMALKNSQVKKLQKQLIVDGFTQKDPEVLTVPVEGKDGLTTEVLFVAIPFKDDKSKEDKTLVYSHNPRTGESTTVVMQGTLSSCVFNLLICLGTTGACLVACAALVLPDPAEPLEVAACLTCLPIAVGACGLAYDACTEYYYG